MKALAQSLKTGVRRIEARFTPRTGAVIFQGHPLRFVRSIWWDESQQKWFDQEIVPYFAAIRNRSIVSVVDAGASTGAFSVAIAGLYPAATVYAFEPAARNRILIERNARLNGLANRIRVIPCGLWDQEAHLTFRTHGAISSFEKVSSIGKGYSFNEIVPVMRLDHWVHEAKIDRLDLVKMDIEGAEIEALIGAEQTLRVLKPDLLVQAYHIRDGARTLERCQEILRKFGYRCEEIGVQSGFLFASAG